MNEKKNLHAGHRERLKKRFLTSGLKDFKQHNILELLLFFAVPYRDQNEISHELINRFGSLNAVFDANFETLIEQKGISEHSAVLLKLIPELARIYFNNEFDGKIKFESVNQIGEYIVPHYIGRTTETVMLFCLDAGNKLISSDIIHEGDVNSSALRIRKITEIALMNKATGVVLSHNHPSGSLIPSSEDINTTKRIVDSLLTNGIILTQHFIIAGKRYVPILDPIVVR